METGVGKRLSLNKRLVAIYHLGNRHEPVQIGDGWLRYRTDHALDAMMREQGLEARHEQAPIEPERGAYHEARESKGSD